ncbi:ABC transporter substrate-binding protein [Pseudomonas sp. NPDC007930]|uniref:ABC transporter substrate-binding protein n=1 Tax=Pseudomonas sp. NPDC007930 TaxID=3364417 RepID=UPI0036E83580
MSANPLYYSICPVYVASHVSKALGWLDSELLAVDARAQRLERHPSGQGAVIHSRHSERYQIRDGGNVPALSARADHSDTVLLASTEVNQGGQVVVRADAPLWRVADLKGLRLGLSRSEDNTRVDWWRANSQRSLQLALRRAGVSDAEVHWVDVAHSPSSGEWRAARAAASNTERVLQLPFTPEFAALERGEVDAIYSTQGRSRIYENTGRFKVIEDLSHAPDWVARIATTPYTLVASKALVDERPEVAVAWLRANLRAARWIRENPLEAARILHQVTYDATVDDVLEVVQATDFTPSLAARNLAALRHGKDWLRQQHYLQNDFAIDAWAQPQWLAQAHASLAELTEVHHGA